MNRPSSKWLLLVVVLTGCAVHGVPRDCPELSSAEAMALAAKIANDECKTRFGESPFSENSFQITLRDQHWYWGDFDPAGIHGFSAVVSFDQCGRNREVEVYYSSDMPKSVYK